MDMAHWNDAISGMEWRHRLISLSYTRAFLPPSLAQTWLSLKNAVPVRLNPLGQNDVNNCLACVAWLAHLAQSQ